MTLGKKEKTNLKSRRGKEIIKIRAEINDIENRKTTESMKQKHSYLKISTKFINL